MSTSKNRRLLHVDSSIRRDESRSRGLTAHYAEIWRQANPGGAVVYRDLDADPLPHIDDVAYSANLLDPDEQSNEHLRAASLTRTIAGEVLETDTIVLGMGLYNLGVPSTVKAWVDRLVVPGLTIDEEGNGLLGGRTLVVALAAGASYGEGSSREGWDHREAWLRQIFGYLGLTDVVAVTAELTGARENPALIPFDLGAAEDRSLADARMRLTDHAKGIPLPA